MKQIESVIFDVDSTVYPPNKVLGKALGDFFVEQVAIANSCDLVQAKVFLEQERAKVGSNTKVLESLGVGNSDPAVIVGMMDESVWEIRRTALLKDQKLIDMMAQLETQGIRAYTLRNGTTESTRWILRRVMGLPEESRSKQTGRLYTDPVGPFQYQGPTAELGHVKPDIEPFLNLLERTGINPETALMVGDRVDVDLETPKRRLKMTTVLVTWDNTPKRAQITDDRVDLVISTVYDLPSVLARS